VCIFNKPWSYVDGYTTDHIIYKWRAEDPVQVTPDLHLPRFALEQFSTDYCDSHTNFGKLNLKWSWLSQNGKFVFNKFMYLGIYSCLRVDILFKREFTYCLLQVYIPCIMLVSVAYLSFWIDRKETTTRTMLPLIALMVMALVTMAHNATLPPVSYTKAIDVWTGMCLTFVFGALVMSVVTNYVGGKNVSTGSGTLGEADGKTKLLEKFSKLDKSQKVDLISRVAYPAFFLLFLVSYCFF